MQEAIKRAIKGGFEWRKYYALPSMAVLDPLFWQALGKAEGRDKVCEDCGTGYSQPRDNCSCSMSSPPLTAWYIYTMHRFTDHLISGGDIDTFFTNLLTK